MPTAPGTPVLPPKAAVGEPEQRPLARPNRGAPGRIMAAGVAAGCLALLVVAFALDPSGAGHGTHTQLGLRPCSWAMLLNRPCPTCGMTTAFAHAADGSLWAAAKTQPFAAGLAVLVSAMFWGALHAACTGSRIGPVAARMVRPRALVVGGLLLLGAWAYKVATWPV